MHNAHSPAPASEVSSVFLPFSRQKWCHTRSALLPGFDAQGLDSWFGTALQGQRAGLILSLWGGLLDLLTTDLLRAIDECLNLCENLRHFSNPWQQAPFFLEVISWSATTPVTKSTSMRK